VGVKIQPILVRVAYSGLTDADKIFQTHDIIYFSPFFPLILFFRDFFAIYIQLIGRLHSLMQAESQGKFILGFLLRAAFIIFSEVSNRNVGWGQLGSVVERTVDDQQYF